jgi:hypothetical protein
MSPERLGHWNRCHEEVRDFDGSLPVSFPEQGWATIRAFDMGHYERVVAIIPSPTISVVFHK